MYSDGSFLSVSKSRSRAERYYYFGDDVPISKPDKQQESTYQECSAIKPVIDSTAKCEKLIFYLDY